MPVAVPVAGFGPVAERAVFIARETIGTPGTIPASAGATFPLSTMRPSDKPEWLENNAWYGDMVDIHGLIQGPMIGGFDIGGPHFGDAFGHAAYNILGDYTVSGTLASPASTVSAPIAAGATTLTVASGGASFTAGMNLWIEDGGTPAANEVVTVASSTATTITLTGPTRFAHLTATPFSNTAAPYTHVFSVLNTLTSIGNGPGQGPTHTVTDRTNIPATGLAAQYAYSCFDELSITGDADKLLMWEGKAISLVRAIAATPPAPAPGTAQPYPSWRSTVKLTPPGGGALTQVNDFFSWSFSIGRKVTPRFTNSGQQAPYMIPRGTVGPVTGKLTVSPAIDESSVLYMLNNTQPQLQVAASNGLTGVNLLSLQIDVGLAAYIKADIADGDELFGYDNEFRCVGTSAALSGGVTMGGASGGAGHIKITLQNAIPTY